jgi:hypothetical protein
VEVRGIAPVRLRSGPMVRTVARPGREMVPVREGQEGVSNAVREPVGPPAALRAVAGP